MAITTITTTSFFVSGTTYRSTIDASSTLPDTVIVGYLQTYTTVTTTSGTVGVSSTIAQPTSTTPGTVQVVIPTPVTTCGNAGIQYALQTNPSARGIGGADPTYSSFLARAFQTIAPQATGATRYMAVPYVPFGTNYAPYGQPPARPLPQETLNHRGYLFAKIGGTFTFTFPASDDISLLWIGANARSTHTRQNANIQQYFIGAVGTGNSVTYTINLLQGTYTPISVLWANAQGDAQFRLTITAPDGSLIANGELDQTPSPFLVQYSCDGVLAPPYPPGVRKGRVCERVERVKV